MAIATTRTKEIGVRKVLGATSLHLVRQYLVEAALLGLVAIVIVVLLAMLVIEPHQSDAVDELHARVADDAGALADGRRRCSRRSARWAGCIRARRSRVCGRSMR